jgi:tripartite ATP-independent transporter DctM subunit
MYDVMNKWTLGLKGGLAIGTVVACTLIAAMTGIATTGVVTMGMLAYPEMRQRNYDKSISIGSIVAGGALGPLIPPSVIMIVVGGFASLSVGKLFIGGLLPGLLMALCFCIYIWIKCSLKTYSGIELLEIRKKITWKDKLRSLYKIILPMLLIVLVLGGLYSGAFTPSEAGGIGAAGTLICAGIYKKLNWKNLREAAITTFKVNAMVMWLIIGGACFSSLCGALGITNFLEDFLTKLPVSPMVILIIMMFMVFTMGMFIETVAITMICIPIFMPIVIKLGFDPLWFALIFVINIIIGVVTPPFGYNLFYMRGLGHKDISVIDIYGAIIPFVMIMVFVLVLCIIFPQICVWLPNTMIK